MTRVLLAGTAVVGQIHALNAKLVSSQAHQVRRLAQRVLLESLPTRSCRLIAKLVHMERLLQAQAPQIVTHVVQGNAL